ncbi:partner of bursicon [Folsomia candida]|uniref:Partner of bursicon n=1 Tax=Folsomia candida TaxID=158441 RepID=A0A226EHD7_FOLCA|nr:partner of bursicon [Folsomia candida]XP_021949897.1 partner of bursicon [Folsomia candida]OXA56710.1 Partner of bursicon [Folsomia candida]
MSLGFIFPLLLLAVADVQVQGTSACETLPSTIHIIKEIYAANGQMERTCEGEVAVSKCEGSCASKVRPSAVSHSGFMKDCQCCRESNLRSREITLTKCYDQDGKLLTGDKETYVISLKEPADCRCYRCGESAQIR